MKKAIKSKQIKVQTDSKTGNGFLTLDQFKEFVDPQKVCFYELIPNEDKTLTLRFYDKNQQLIKIA